MLWPPNLQIRGTALAWDVRTYVRIMTLNNADLYQIISKHADCIVQTNQIAGRIQTNQLADNMSYKTDKVLYISIHKCKQMLQGVVEKKYGLMN